jgi:hypothetical protein
MGLIYDLLDTRDLLRCVEKVCVLWYQASKSGISLHTTLPLTLRQSVIALHFSRPQCTLTGNGWRKMDFTVINLQTMKWSSFVDSLG